LRQFDVLSIDLGGNMKRITIINLLITILIILFTVPTFAVSSDNNESETRSPISNNHLYTDPETGVKFFVPPDFFLKNTEESLSYYEEKAEKERQKLLFDSYDQYEMLFDELLKNSHDDNLNYTIFFTNGIETIFFGTAKVLETSTVGEKGVTETEAYMTYLSDASQIVSSDTKIIDYAGTQYIYDQSSYYGTRYIHVEEGRVYQFKAPDINSEYVLKIMLECVIYPGSSRSAAIADSKKASDHYEELIKEKATKTSHTYNKPWVIFGVMIVIVIVIILFIIIKFRQIIKSNLKKEKDDNNP